MRHEINGAAIVAMPNASLPAIVDVLLRSPDVAAVVVGEQVEASALAALAKEPAGLEELLPVGTEIHTESVAQFADKVRCVAKIAQFAATNGATRVEPIEQSMDELVMNALFDAPVDERGSHIFADTPPRTRVTMRTDQRVVVQYACANKRLTVLVRDAFGSIVRDTVVRHLHKALHAADAVDQKAGGAGLGLYLMATAASAVMFHVVPGVATTIVCTFDLDTPKRELAQFGFIVHDAAGRAPTPPARMIAIPNRRRRIIAAAIALVVVTAAGITLPRVLAGPPTAQITFTTTAGAAIDLDGKRIGTASAGTISTGDLTPGRAYRAVARLAGFETRRAVVQTREGANGVAFELQPLATVELDSQPSDAIVEINGRSIGSTPLELTTLAPGATVSMVFARPGYRPATLRVQVPARGQRQRFVQPLQADDNLVPVRFVSNPPGAAIVREGQQLVADRTYTPAEVFVELGQLQRFTLVMPGHAPLSIEPFTAVRGARLEKGGDLQPMR